MKSRLLLNPIVETLVSLAKKVEFGIESLTDHRLFGDRADWLVAVRPFETYGTPQRLRFRGRVLRDHAFTKATVKDTWWRNLWRTFHLLESDEVPGAKVEISFGDHRVEAVADAEGYVDAWIDLTESTSQPETSQSRSVECGWHAITATLRQTPFGKKSDLASVCWCLVPDADAEFGIISDIDDTVLQSDVTRPLKMFALLMFQNQFTRTAVDQTPELYRELVRGGDGRRSNPVIYVSSSPWNLHPMLSGFMKAVGLPRGPMMLRDLGIGRDADLGLNHGHKEIKILEILDTYPNIQFVLMGDAGQEDAAIYSRVCEARGDQILAAYIRGIDGNPRDRVVQAVSHARSQNLPVFLLPGTTSIRQDLIKRGLIATGTIQPSGGSVEFTERLSPGGEVAAKASGGKILSSADEPAGHVSSPADEPAGRTVRAINEPQSQIGVDGTAGTLR